MILDAPGKLEPCNVPCPRCGSGSELLSALDCPWLYLNALEAPGSTGDGLKGAPASPGACLGLGSVVESRWSTLRSTPCTFAMAKSSSFVVAVYRSAERTP